MGKTEKFTGANVDLGRLAQRVESYLQENDFQAAFSKDPTEPASWFFIQAIKASALRTVAGVRRSTDITMKGEPDNFEVTIGTGEWGKNLLSSAPLMVVPVVGIVATLAKLYTGKRFEDSLWKYVRDQVKYLHNTAVGAESAADMQATTANGSRPASLPSISYAAEYIQGYPGWSSRQNGNFVLQKGVGGNNSLVFKPNSAGEDKQSATIRISASSVTHAEIITQKTGLIAKKDDKMIQLLCQDSSGRMITPVFNFNDDIIAGILAGINELVADDIRSKTSSSNIEQATKYAQQERAATAAMPEAKFCTKCGTKLYQNANFCSNCGERLG